MQAVESIRRKICFIGAGLYRRPVFYIGGSDTLPPPLTRDEELALLTRMDTDGARVRATLIERNLRLVVYIARRFESSGVGLEDLISIGTIGLIKAVNSFRPEKKIKLATYASRCIENEILMVLRRTSRTRYDVSFDEPLSVDIDGNELLMRDVLGTDEDIVSRDIDADVEKTMLREAISRLDARETDIIALRYGLRDGQERTQKEVADLMGISQSYISRIEKRIIAKLQTDMEKMA